MYLGGDNGEVGVMKSAQIKKTSGSLTRIHGGLPIHDHLFPIHCSYPLFTNPTFTVSPSKASSTTDAFAGAAAKFSLTVSVSDLM